jgi:TfoX/Sxy family transcriptional regulator of competence genes
MKKTTGLTYQDKVALFDALVATNRAVNRKGATMPYTSVNGNMFSVVTKDGILALRLPADVQDAFLRKYKTTVPVMYGTVMKEYVVVPDALLEKTKELRKYFDLSYAYAGSLKAKPTTKKKGAKKKGP